MASRYTIQAKIKPTTLSPKLRSLTYDHWKESVHQSNREVLAKQMEFAREKQRLSNHFDYRVVDEKGEVVWTE